MDDGTRMFKKTIISTWGLALSGLMFSAGCAGTCEDDGFGQADLGPNCPLGPIAMSASSTDDGSTTDTSSSSDPPAESSSSTEPQESSSSSSPIATTTYCTDADADGFGDPDACFEVPRGDTPPENAVLDASDCDDTSEHTFPGAAQTEDADACMRDVDDDGFGDLDPPAGVVAGTDCDDSLAEAFPGAASEEPDLCAIDADADGWADTMPPAGVDAGSDCLDDNPNAFPGAAELDDDVACMEDADDDGYGDSMPPAGANAGSDCLDDDDSVPAASACLVWCIDTDNDQYGDESECVITPVAPPGYVGNAADCDDTNPNAFPGAAPLDDEEACLEDADGDDYGSEAPSNPAIGTGSDCDDLEPLVSDACFDCPAGTFYCDTAENVAQCNDQGTFGAEVSSCTFGCDDGTASCWSALSVDAGTCVNVPEGESGPLFAEAMGGDGDYTYAWSPIDTATPIDQALTSVTPAANTRYTVMVDDGHGNAAQDDVFVHVPGHHRILTADGCEAFAYPGIFPPDQNPSSESFFVNETAYCNTTGNTLPTVYVCPEVFEDALVEFQFQVTSLSDNDGIGFVWGWQDAAHFYLLSWKQETEVAPSGTWEQGITIKRMEADDPADITPADLIASFDTPNATVLATPADVYDEGWIHRNEYRASLLIQGDSTTITLRDFETNALVMTTTVVDDAYPMGAVGSYEASQRTACLGLITSSCAVADPPIAP